MTEYKKILNYENYQIGTDGSVWSLRTSVPKRLKPQIKPNGYYTVILYSNHIPKKCYIHRLVAETFIPNPNNYPCVNHKDENKNNNNIENLEWCTYEYNNNYGSHNTNAGEGRKKPILQLLDGIVIKRWKSAIDVERELNIQSRNIAKVLKGKRKTAGGYMWAYEQ